jgi:hypothetical protein
MLESTNAHTAISYRYWLSVSAIVFVVSLILGLVCVILLNKGNLNHVLTPIFQYFGIFRLIFPDQPIGALQFILSKSLVAFAHKDPRSALNLWTYEFDGITVLVYLLSSLTLGYCFALYLRSENRGSFGPLFTSIAGAVLLLFSVSYMTVIEHCSGATWAGFVALYGLGFDELALFPAYQWLNGGLGTVLLIWGWQGSRTRYSHRHS